MDAILFTFDEIGSFLQNFKNLEIQRIEKWLIHPMEGVVKLFS